MNGGKMKSRIIFGGVAAVLLAASIVENYMMIQRLAEVERKVNDFTPHQINIPKELQTQIVDKLAADNKKGIEAFSEKLSDIEKKNTSQIDAITEKVNKLVTDSQNGINVFSKKLSDIESLQSTNRQSLEQHIESLKNAQKSSEDTVTEKLSDIEKRSSARIKAIAEKVKQIGTVQSYAKENAAKSFEIAKQLKEQGNFIGGKTYAINAINHQKDNPEYLRFYADMVIEDPNVAPAEVDQVLAVLDASLFNVTAENISGILALRNRVAQKKSQLAVNTAAPTIDLKEEIKSVTTGEYAIVNIMKGNSVNSEALKQRIEKINVLLGEELNDKQRNQLTDDLRISTNIYSAELAFENVMNAFHKAFESANTSALSDEQILVARNQLATANTLLAQIWTADLPVEVVKRAEDIQKKIAVTDEKLNVLASKEAMKRYSELNEKLNFIKDTIVKDGIAPFAKYRTGRLTGYLKDIQEYSAEMQTLRILDKEGQKKIIETLRKAQKLASEIIAKRYQAYQLWSLDLIKKAYDSRNSVGASAYRDWKAKQDFEYYLMPIDRSLLTYDVGTCYDKIFNEIFQEQIPDSDKADLQFKKATNEKMAKLEDF